MALPEKPGLAVSGGVHAGLLALALVTFSRAPQLDAAQESIPVTVLSSSQFNEIMKGEKTAAEVKPLPRSEQTAKTAELTPRPSPSDAPKDIPAEPSPLKRQPDPGTAETKEKPLPAQAAAAQAPKPAPRAEPLKAAAAPKPQPRVNELKSDDGETAAHPPAPKPSAAPAKAPPKFKPDQLAKLLEQEKNKEADKETKEQRKPAAKPKSGDEAAEPQRKFDLGSIARFLSKEMPQRRQARGQELNQIASLGSPTASAARMSPSLWGQLDGLLQEQYKRCWNFSGLGGQQKYIPEIHVQYAQDGSLTGEPVLLNPPSDPNLRPLAESAMRAVRRCDPLHIPAIYQPYYEQWKGRIVRFDPEDML